VLRIKPTLKVFASKILLKRTKQHKNI